MSNCVDNDENEHLITLFCFDVRKFCHDEIYGDGENDLESGDIYLRPQTWLVECGLESET
ncbi:2441_t:CDS:2 [Diversispora eburnea]|uniref:2441_t:CDS:1 n=1 Tax=Diversispora eburnea TaxID=1213867 RepID=A0A9N9BW75_9GLOM|nr:2441_t:CDS:2 [Diversispora eburnea]